MINLSETLKRCNAKINIKDYTTFSKNRAEGAGGGGISTSVTNSLKTNTTKVAEDNEDDEFMVTRFDHVKPALNVVHIYGRIEGREGGKPPNVMKSWTKILKELRKIESKQEAVLVCGDLNRAVGCGIGGVVGNKSEVSYGGWLVRELIATGDYHMLLNSSLTKGGPWTRVCPATGSPSCLDLSIASSNLLPFVRQVLVDSARMFTPRRAITKDGRITVTFTDHYGVVVDLEMPRSGLEQKSEPQWNTKKPGGWKAFAEAGEKLSKTIQEISEDDGYSSEEVMEKVEQINTKMKWIAFDKTKPKTRKEVVKGVEQSEEEQGKQLLTKQNERMEAEIKKIKAENKGRVTQVYKMRELIAGTKKAAQEANAIVDFRTNELVVSNSEIKQVTLDYCLQVLSNNEPDPRVKELVQYKEIVHNLRMMDKENDYDNEITDEDFFMVLAKFESKKSRSYDFIVNAGIKYKLAIFQLCKRFINKEEFPSSFDITTLIQLPKKGSLLYLDNSRYLHIKEWPARLVEALTVREMKDPIFSAGTKYQIGGCPGQRTQFHLFVIKSLIALRLQPGGRGLVLTILDIIKFFDKQSLVDAMDALYQAKVNPKNYRVWYKLNQNTIIQVKTGAGLSARGLAGQVTGQGGGGAALASALNLDLGLHSYFRGSRDEECYGRIRLQPLSYVDDTARASQDVTTMRAGNTKLACLMMEKQLEIHNLKSGFLIFGTEAFKAASRLDVQESPVMLGKVQINEKITDKYLGDILSSLGLRASVEATVKEREAKIKGSIYELRALTEDFRMQAVGGMQSAIDLYESCIIPSLLSNSGTWTEVGQETINMLDKIQDTFGRVLLSLPKSAQRASLQAALGLVGMKWRVWQEKILLAQAIRNQEEGGLASEILEEQLAMAWPGLGKEVSEICAHLKLPDASRMEIDKETIQKAVRYDHLKAVKSELKGDKLKEMARSDISTRRQYTAWSLAECRMAYRLETRMFICRANMPKLYNRDLICRNCTPEADQGAGGPIEDQDHLEVCSGFSSLWAGLGPLTARARVQYFLRVDHQRRGSRSK